MKEMMSLGMTQAEICAELGISKRTFINWKDQHHGSYENSWWARRGRDNIGEGKDFNTPLFALYMANMFRWRGVGSKNDEVMEELREIKEYLGMPDHT
jgi:hypothetical protein